MEIELEDRLLKGLKEKEYDRLYYKEVKDDNKNITEQTEIYAEKGKYHDLKEVEEAIKQYSDAGKHPVTHVVPAPAPSFEEPSRMGGAYGYTFPNLGVIVIQRHLYSNKDVDEHECIHQGVKGMFDAEYLTRILTAWRLGDECSYHNIPKGIKL